MSVAAIHTHGMPFWIHQSFVQFVLSGSSGSLFDAAAPVGVNPADQRFWLLFPLSRQLQEKV